jgi:hypothetical protein
MLSPAIVSVPAVLERAHQQQVVGIHERLEVCHLCARLWADQELRPPATKILRSLERQFRLELRILDGGDKADPGGIAREVPVHILDGHLHCRLAGPSQCGPLPRQREETAQQDVAFRRLGGASAGSPRRRQDHQSCDGAADADAWPGSVQGVQEMHAALRIGITGTRQLYVFGLEAVAFANP